ncbi:MAG: integrase core domain-containing protein [Rhodospirillales bacterium]|nr:integrase core domain-containing protein [Rhodospirillales bacterium]
MLSEQWRNHYNTLRPHSALAYRPSTPQTMKSSIIHSTRLYDCAASNVLVQNPVRPRRGSKLT